MAKECRNAWVATRPLSTTALPPDATRLETWRVDPGSMPELLLTTATITFTPGDLYQLWLVPINSKGKSPQDPVQNWTAV